MNATTRLLLTFTFVLPACTPDPNVTDSASASSSGPASTSDAASTSSTSNGSSPTSTSDTSTTTSDASSSPTSTSDASSTSDTTAMTGGSTGGLLTCGMEGGICVGAGTCVPANGAIAPSSPGGCFFDDGPAECCVPPAPKPDAKTCADAGGLCAPIGGCLDAGGYFTSIDDGCEFQGNFACCVPHDRCGEQTIDCCDGQAVFRPSCDDGMLVCTVGEPKPIGTCL